MCGCTLARKFLGVFDSVCVHGVYVLVDHAPSHTVYIHVYFDGQLNFGNQFPVHPHHLIAGVAVELARAAAARARRANNTPAPNTTQNCLVSYLASTLHTGWRPGTKDQSCCSL